MEPFQVKSIKLTEQRLDSVHQLMQRVQYRSWAYNYWSGVYAYLLRRLNALYNDKDDIRERVNYSCSLH